MFHISINYFDPFDGISIFFAYIGDDEKKL